MGREILAFPRKIQAHSGITNKKLWRLCVRSEVNVVHLTPLRRLVAFTLQTNGLASGSWNVAHRVRYTKTFGGVSSGQACFSPALIGQIVGAMVWVAPPSLGNESVEWPGAFHLHIGLPYAVKVFQGILPPFPFSLPVVGRCMNNFVMAESRANAGRGHRIGSLPMVPLPIGLWLVPAAGLQ